MKYIPSSIYVNFRLFRSFLLLYLLTLSFLFFVVKIMKILTATPLLRPLKALSQSFLSLAQVSVPYYSLLSYHCFESGTRYSLNNFTVTWFYLYTERNNYRTQWFSLDGPKSSNTNFRCPVVSECFAQLLDSNFVIRKMKIIESN
jgi:hypothetical protein